MDPAHAYVHRCRCCGLEITSPDTPTIGGLCPLSDEDAPHRWVRLIPTLHFAFHEAGHAVVAAGLGGNDCVTRVRIEGKGAYTTRHTLDRGDPRVLLATLAGGVSVGLVGPPGDLAEHDHGRFRRDLLLWLEAGLLTADLVEPDAYDRLGPVLRAAEATFAIAAERLVAHWQDPIARVADALVEHRLLEGDLLADVLRRAGIAPAPAWLRDDVLDRFFAARMWRTAAI